MVLVGEDLEVASGARALQDTAQEQAICKWRNFSGYRATSIPGDSRAEARSPERPAESAPSTFLWLLQTTKSLEPFSRDFSSSKAPKSGVWLGDSQAQG